MLGLEKGIFIPAKYQTSSSFLPLYFMYIFGRGRYRIPSALLQCLCGSGGNPALTSSSRKCRQVSESSEDDGT